jgi:type III restriction enzyme
LPARRRWWWPGHIEASTEALMLAQVRGAKKQEQLREQVAQHNALVAAQRGPRIARRALCARAHAGLPHDAQAPLWPLEREAVLERWSWTCSPPGGAAARLSCGARVERVRDRPEGRRVTLRPTDVQQMAMDYGAAASPPTTWCAGWTSRSSRRCTAADGHQPAPRLLFWRPW